MIAGLDHMMIERLNAYKDINKSLPKRIVIFYAGSLDGRTTKVTTVRAPAQHVRTINTIFTSMEAKYGKLEPVEPEVKSEDIKFTFNNAPIYGKMLASGKVEYKIKHKTAFALELDSIRAAFKSQGSNYNPLLTIITCARSNHTRFYTFDGANAENPKAGTVVDEGVTGGFNFEFYLQSHATHDKVKDQTVRPTKYTVIYDESALSADDVQQGIHALCYTSQSATRSLSVVPPARWAAKASSHARAYLHDLKYAKGSKVRWEKAKVQVKAEKGFLHEDLKGTMFYL